VISNEHTMTAFGRKAHLAKVGEDFTRRPKRASYLSCHEKKRTLRPLRECISRP